MTAPSGTVRRLLVRAFLDGLAALDGTRAVARALSAHPRPPRGAVVLAVGKGAPAMMRGALEAWGPAVRRALVVVTEGTPWDLPLGPALRVLEAPHPLPDERSVDAARQAAGLVASARGRPFVALVSGGASSLLCAPRGVTLADKRALGRALLRSGAPIDAINTIRRHMSAIKGGALGALAAPSPVLTLLASDVLGGGLFDIGSGPTIPDPTTVHDARRLLVRYAPAFAGLPLSETVKPWAPLGARSRAHVVLGPASLASAVAESLRSVGFAPRLLPLSRRSVEDLAGEYEERARTLAPGEALVRSAEPSVRIAVSRPGKGGRSTHLAALVATRLPPGVAFLAGASDGVDGESESAGAAVDLAAFEGLGLVCVLEGIARYDTASLHAAAGTLIRTLPTGVNVADVHVLARRP